MNLLGRGSFFRSGEGETWSAPNRSAPRRDDSPQSDEDRSFGAIYAKTVGFRDALRKYFCFSIEQHSGKPTYEDFRKTLRQHQLVREFRFLDEKWVEDQLIKKAEVRDE